MSKPTDSRPSTPSSTEKQLKTDSDSVASKPGVTHKEFSGRQFGTVQLFDHDGRHILIPQPSDSPDDPLNWSKPFKNYIAILVCFAVLCSTITGAGPSIAIIEQVIEFFGAPPTKIQKTAYLFSSTSLANGVGLFFWVPAINKYGRRPVYITSLAIYFATLFWCGFTKSFTSELIGRIVLGLASGAAECLGAITITDLFFTHERGTYMAYYNVFLSCGAAIGLITDGAITQHLTWRHLYYVDAAIVGALLILVILTFPETAYQRSSLLLSGHVGKHRVDPETGKAVASDHPADGESKKTWAQKLAFYSGPFTGESILRMAIRPLGVVFLPAVLYSTLIFSVTIGFLVAVTSNAAPAYQGAFGFTTQETGFLFFGALVGSLLGIPCGGQLGDWVADRAARRNGGVREPEQRLPAMIISMITGPLSLILYGLCIEKHTHWFVGCLGISLVNFTLCAATNITMVYSIDCYKPISAEVVTATLGYKAAISFALGFYTNDWVVGEGYLPAYGEMAGISAFFFLTTIPMYFYGKTLRIKSAKWRVLRWTTQWDDDRDDLKIQ